MKDTVPTDKEDDKVDGDQDARKDRPSVGHNAIVHDGGPVLSCQDLRDSQVIHSFMVWKDGVDTATVNASPKADPMSNLT